MRLNPLPILGLTARRLRAARSDERGLTMILVIAVLFVVSLMVVAVLTAANGETVLSRNDLDQQKAYSASQAGIQDYVFKLNGDVNYWTHCNAEVNQPIPSATTTDEKFSTSPIAASTSPAPHTCDVNNPVASMIEGASSAAGTFRIKTTGLSGKVSRTFVSTFKRASFLNYMYYTRFETFDPAATSDPAGNAACAAPYGPPSTAPYRPSNCTKISFVTGDVINGPLHSEDTLAICGSPTFGRTSGDTIEAPAHSTEGQSCGGDNANMLGTFNASAQSLLPPPSNAQLLNIVTPAAHYTGTTYITLTGNSYTVTNNGVTTPGVSYPANGVIYVSTNASTGCPVTYSPYNVNYAAGPGCGNVYVSGNYTSSLTIASDNDIIVNGNITTPTTGGVPNTASLLGLIANNFVRVYHPVNNRASNTSGGCGNNSSNGAGSISNINIYAALLSVNHSFIVDNYDCGSGLGTLKVYGAIAQIFRGPVGTGSASTGYLKNYTYDDRLAAEEPPYFLNPVEAAWTVQRMTECTTGGAPC